MESKRVSYIDGLRGFSLLGILLANLLIFQYGMFGKEYLDSLRAFDEGALYFVKVFIEGSAMPIFAVVFGYSLIKFIHSIRQKRMKSRWKIVRRFIGLIGLGFLHTFIWDGDILLVYGAMMILLIPFINRKPKTLFITGAVLFVLSTALMYGKPVESESDKAAMMEYVEEANEVYANGSYSEINHFRNNVLPPIFEDPILVIIMVLILPFNTIPMFLIGMGLAKIHAFEQRGKERKWYKVGSCLVPIGLIFKTIAQFEHSWTAIALTGGSFILSLGYISLFALIYQTKFISRIGYVFENVGKLSLTNYIIQSVICTFFFYGYGLGFYGELGVALGVLFGLVVYAMQCVFSTFYLKWFKRGPLEVVLRVWTNFSLTGKTKVKKAKEESVAYAGN